MELLFLIPFFALAVSVVAFSGSAVYRIAKVAIVFMAVGLQWAQIFASLGYPWIAAPGLLAFSLGVRNILTLTAVVVIVRMEEDYPVMTRFVQKPVPGLSWL